MPDVVVASECAVSATWRKWRIWDDGLFKEVEGGFIAQGLESPLAPFTWRCPKSFAGKVDVRKWNVWQLHGEIVGEIESILRSGADRGQIFLQT
jgi:hypothetical protein